MRVMLLFFGRLFFPEARIYGGNDLNDFIFLADSFLCFFLDSLRIGGGFVISLVIFSGKVRWAI